MRHAALFAASTARAAPQNQAGSPYCGRPACSISVSISVTAGAACVSAVGLRRLAGTQSATSRPWSTPADQPPSLHDQEKVVDCVPARMETVADPDPCGPENLNVALPLASAVGAPVIGWE